MRLERRRDAGNQRHGVVVAVCELHPAADPRIQVAPLRDESRFPVTRRSRNQHHPAALRDLPQRSEAGPRYRIGPHRRNQHRRRVQQAPTLERRRRTRDSSDLRPSSTILSHAWRCRQAPQPERQGKPAEDTIFYMRFIDHGHGRPPFTGGRSPAAPKLEPVSGREYQPFWPMKDQSPHA